MQAELSNAHGRIECLEDQVRRLRLGHTRDQEVCVRYGRWLQCLECSTRSSSSGSGGSHSYHGEDKDDDETE